MNKLTILFEKPDDLERFEQRWSHEFVPAVEKMPGLKRVMVGRVAGTIMGVDEVYLVHEFLFESASDLHAAMASEEGQQAGRKLMEIAPHAVRMFFSEHFEEDH